MAKEQKKIFIGCDHAGFSLKQALLPRWKEKFTFWIFEDCGCFNDEPTNYPEYAAKVARSVVEERGRGILICGSGIGMAIAANKIVGARAAQVWDVTSARLSREHNDSNIVCVGARLVGPQVAFDAVSVWLSAAFDGGRHQGRIDLIKKLEGETSS